MGLRATAPNANGVRGLDLFPTRSVPPDEAEIALSVNSIAAQVNAITPGVLPGIYLPPPGNAVDQGPRFAAALAAIKAIPGGYGGTILLGDGVYHLNQTFVVDFSSVTIRGTGAASAIIFDPPIDSNFHAAFKFDSGVVGQTLSHCGVVGVQFGGSGTAAKRIAIHVVDASQFVGQGIVVLGWTGAGSEGVRVEAREAQWWQNLLVTCDVPLRVAANATSIIADHMHFQDCWLTCTDNARQCVLIDPGVVLQDMTFDGYQAWVNGLYGLLWADTIATGTSRNLDIRNVRFERQANVGGAMARIALTGAQGLLGFGAYNCITGDPVYDMGGFYLRGTPEALIEKCRVNSIAPTTSLDIDASDAGLVRIATPMAGTIQTGALGPIGVANARVITYV